MMTIRPLAFAALAMFGACDNTTLEQEQQQERRSLGVEQAQERQKLNQQQGQERQEVRQDAREELRDTTADLRSERGDVAEAAADLAALTTRACAGVPAPELDSCPLDFGNVSSVNDVNRGVRVRFTTRAGNEEKVQRSVDCYRARREVQAATRSVMPAPPLGDATAPGVTPALPVPGSVCLLDMPGLSIDIDTQGSFVDATLTVPAGPLVLQLQQRAHDMTDRRGASLR